MASWGILYELTLLLFGALALGGLCSRFGQSPIVGYLIAGMLLGGPGSLDAIDSEEKISFNAELGVSLLLFSIGLEFSFKRFLSLAQRACSPAPDRSH